MGHWAKVVGGAIGGLVGGPAGAAVGVGVGALFDADDEQPAPLPGFEARVQFEDDPDGRFHVVEAPLRDGAVLVARLLNAEGTAYIESRCPEFADDDGDFVSGGVFENGLASFYVPVGALKGRAGNRAVLLELVALFEGEVAGRERFEGHIRFAPHWSVALHWRPVIGLCMAVARADGRLLRDEIKAIRNFVELGLELPSGEQQILKDLLKEEPSTSIDELAIWLLRRFPTLSLDGLLDTLADVAKSDGEVAEAEVDVIRQVALFYGVPEASLPDLEEELGLATIEATRLKYLEVLALSEGASRQEIKKAYRAKVIQYHPDRVASLAPEFQQLAQRKTIELREAYEALLVSAS